MAIPTALLEAGRPATADIVVKQGDTFLMTITVRLAGVAVDITGLTAAMKIKATIGGTLLATPTCAVPVGSDGKILATMTPAVTAALTATGTAREVALGFWDCALSDGTDKVTVAGGAVSLWRKVTA